MRDSEDSFSDFRALLKTDEQEMSVVISDPALPDNPMIYVSEQFEAQTGYTLQEAVGRNCRFLQGPETDTYAIEAIRQGLKARTQFSIDLLNYRRDGTRFMNRLRIRPLFGQDGKLLYYVGAQNPV